MNSRIPLLIKAYLEGSSFLAKGKREELKSRRRVWIGSVVLLGVTLGGGTLISLLVQNYRELYLVGEHFGYPHFPLLASLMFSWVVVLVFSFTSSLSILYRSRDNLLLGSLPLKPRDIVCSRLCILYLYAFPFFAVFYLPAAGVFGYYFGWSFSYAASVLLVLFFGPVIPLMISALLSSLLVRLASSSRWRTALEVAGMVLLIGAVILIQSLLMGVSAGDAADHEGLIAVLTEYIASLFERLIPLNWAAESAMPGNTWKILLFCGISGAGGMLFAALISRRYLALLSGEASHAARGLPRTAERRNRRRGITAALLQREWDVITSNSTYIMESFAQLLILPILLIVMGITGTIGELERYGEILFDLPYFELIIFGILLLMTVLNSVPATSISREGRCFSVSRSLPVSGICQVRAKILFQLLFFTPAFLIYYGVLQLLLPMDGMHLIYAVPGGIVFLALSGVIGLMIDLSRPLLDWTHPQQAMKQNTNVLISMGINALILGFCVLLVFLLTRISLPDIWIGSSAVIFAAVLLSLLYPKLLRLAEYRYQADL